MARSDAERRAEQALKALIAPRENAVRALAQSLDNIASVDARIEALHAERNSLVGEAQKAFDAAKAAGWKQRELTDAGLAVPRAKAPAAPAAEPTPSA